jgi:hypothetical protein
MWLKEIQSLTVWRSDRSIAATHDPEAMYAEQHIPTKSCPYILDHVGVANITYTYSQC